MSGDGLRDSVIGDLKWLTSQDFTKLDEDGLRELSGRLRRLLIEGSLHRYRKQTGAKGELHVEAPELPAVDSSTIYAQAAGAERSVGKVAAVSVYSRALSPEEIRAMYEAQPDGPRLRVVPLSRWLDSPCIYVQKVRVKRRDLIKYVANKLGGVHFDERRDPAKDHAFTALDHARSTKLTDLDAVYAEVAAIGQQLAASTEIRALLTESPHPPAS
jgi:hypothetical protein